ncbi:hypothetical protein CPB85DRAFT_85812 [Mucidula mucida]|nr:hypothetical protein CPB85DRAFT_85812 [Mucidula mucida]
MAPRFRLLSLSGFCLSSLIICPSATPRPVSRVSLPLAPAIVRKSFYCLASHNFLPPRLPDTTGSIAYVDVLRLNEDTVTHGSRLTICGAIWDQAGYVSLRYSPDNRPTTSAARTTTSSPLHAFPTRNGK